jgi:hypothetical protein
MAWHQISKKRCFDLGLGGETLIFALGKTTFVDDPDLDNPADLPAGWESDAAAYVRKTEALGATPTTRNDASNEVDIDVTNKVWSALGSGPEDPINQLVLLRSVVDDTDHEIVGTISFSQHTPDGSEFELDIQGLLRGTNV